MKAPMKCPICGSRLTPQGPAYSLDELLALWAPVKFSPEVVAEHRRQADHTRLYVCARCEFGVFAPQIIGTGAFYEALQADPAAPYYVEDKWEFGEAVNDFAPGASIIELGCGPGNFLTAAQSRAGRVVGSEYNAKAQAIARARGFEVLGPEAALDPYHGVFDAAFSFHVLEHVSDPVAFVSTLAALVKPGGRIGISVPNDKGVIRFVMPCASNMPPHHASHWSAVTFKALAERLGLRIRRIAYEPLALRDSYYLQHWAANRFPKYSRRAALFTPLAKKFTGKYVNRLKKLGFETIPGFHGLAIYVVLEKQSA